LVVGMLSVAGAVLAQTGDNPAPGAACVLSGRILEKGTKDPIQSGSILLEPASANGESIQALSAEADLKGNFQLNAPAGTYRLTVAGEGYQKTVLPSFELKGNQTKNLYLQKEGFTLPEVEVSTAKETKNAVSHEALSREEMFEVPGTMQDPLKAVQSLPGIVTAGSLNGQILDRGNGPYDNLYLVDRIPIGFPFHFSFFSTLDPDLVKDLDFYAGGSGPQYTDELGGVVDVTQRDPRNDRWGFRADVNAIMSQFGIEGPLTSDSSLALAARRSYVDLVIKNISSADYGTFNAPVFQDYQVKYSWNPTPKTHFDFVALGSDDTESGDFTNVPNVTSLGFPANVFVPGNFSINLGYNSQGTNFKDTSDDHNLFTNTLYHTNFYFNLGEGLGLYGHDSLDDVGDWFSWTHVFDDDTRLEGGAHYDHYTNSLNAYFVALPGQGQPDFNVYTAPKLLTNGSAPSNNADAYLSQKFSLFEKHLELAAGGDVEYLSSDNTPFFAPRVSGAFHFTPDTTLKASYGINYESAGQITGTDYLDSNFGNPSLAPEKSIYEIASLEQKITPEGLFIRVEGYNKDLSELFVSDPNTIYDNNGSGYARGMEVLLRQPPTERFFGWVSYAFSDSERRNGDAQPLYLYDFDEPNVVTAVGNYKLNPGWDVGLKWTYATGRPYTPVTGAAYNSTYNAYIPSYGPVNSARLPDAARLDFSTSFKTVYDTWEWEIYLDILNVTANNNVLGYQSNAAYTSQTAQTDVPFLPYFGFEAKY